MHFQRAPIRLLTIALMVYATDASWGYAAKNRHARFQESSQILKLVTEYNESTGTTRSLVQSIPVPIAETAEFSHLFVNAAVDYPGRKPSVPEDVTIGFGSRPCHMSGEPEPEVTIWADGRQVYSGVLRRSFCDGGFRRESEFGTVNVPYAGFVEIAEAKGVQVQMREHQFVLNDDAIRGLQKLINLVKEG